MNHQDAPADEATVPESELLAERGAAYRLPKPDLTPEMDQAFGELVWATEHPIANGSAVRILAALMWMRANPEKADVLLARQGGQLEWGVLNPELGTIIDKLGQDEAAVTARALAEELRSTMVVVSRPATSWMVATWEPQRVIKYVEDDNITAEARSEGVAE